MLHLQLVMIYLNMFSPIVIFTESSFNSEKKNQHVQTHPQTYTLLLPSPKFPLPILLASLSYVSSWFIPVTFCIITKILTVFNLRSALKQCKKNCFHSCSFQCILFSSFLGQLDFMTMSFFKKGSWVTFPEFYHV